jgi:predicted DNA-binding transcriptional regulator AlpA
MTDSDALRRSAPKNHNKDLTRRGASSDVTRHQVDQPIANIGALLTIAEAARLLHLTPAALYKYRSRGEGPRGYNIGKRVLFTSDDIASWVTARREDQRAR